MVPGLNDYHRAFEGDVAVWPQLCVWRALIQASQSVSVLEYERIISISKASTAGSLAILQTVAAAYVKNSSFPLLQCLRLEVLSSLLHCRCSLSSSSSSIQSDCQASSQGTIECYGNGIHNTCLDAVKSQMQSLPQHSYGVVVCACCCCCCQTILLSIACSNLALPICCLPFPDIELLSVRLFSICTVRWLATLLSHALWFLPHLFRTGRTFSRSIRTAACSTPTP